jgi:pyridoxal/pyridoxine/pyridoxamine kinase
VSVPLVAKTVFGTRANWKRLIELLNDFVEVVSDLANIDHPIMPRMIFTGYRGSEDPTRIVKMKVYTTAKSNGSRIAHAYPR